MESFKASLKKRLYAIAGYCLIVLVLIGLGLFHPTGGSSEEFNSFIAGFNVGLAMVAIVVSILSVIKYSSALKDDEKLKALYIEEHDERLLFIDSKIGGTAMQIVLFGLLAATIAAGFINQTVFFTLLGALLFCAFVKAVLKLYYTKKVS